jgi:hypothetical protein
LDTLCSAGQPERYAGAVVQYNIPVHDIWGHHFVEHFPIEVVSADIPDNFHVE